MGLILIGIFWFITGLSGFLFWWSKDYTTSSSFTTGTFLAGIACGPFAWLIGWFIHGKFWNKYY